MNPVYPLLRHYLATLAFRTHHVLEGAPDGFGEFQAGHGVRAPKEIVRHMTGLLLFVHHRFMPFELEPPPPLSWPEELERFFDIVALVDDDLAKNRALRLKEHSLEQLLQGPLMDALTHVGQLATLRRLAGDPVERRISYLTAEIHVGDTKPR